MLLTSEFCVADVISWIIGETWCVLSATANDLKKQQVMSMRSRFGGNLASLYRMEVRNTLLLGKEMVVISYDYLPWSLSISDSSSGFVLCTRWEHLLRWAVVRSSKFCLFYCLAWPLQQMVTKRRKKAFGEYPRIYLLLEVQDMFNLRSFILI